MSALFARRRRNDPIAALTDREREVLELVAEGRSNRAIGQALFITDRTVESHIQHVFDKLGLLNVSAPKSSPASSIRCSDDAAPLRVACT